MDPAKNSRLLTGAQYRIGHSGGRIQTNHGAYTEPLRHSFMEVLMKIFPEVANRVYYYLPGMNGSCSYHPSEESESSVTKPTERLTKRPCTKILSILRCSLN